MFFWGLYNITYSPDNAPDKLPSPLNMTIRAVTERRNDGGNANVFRNKIPTFKASSV